jgi:hypothetical protein
MVVRGKWLLGQVLFLLVASVAWGAGEPSHLLVAKSGRDAHRLGSELEAAKAALPGKLLDYRIGSHLYDFEVQVPDTGFLSAIVTVDPETRPEVEHLLGSLSEVSFESLDAILAEQETGAPVVSTESPAILVAALPDRSLATAMRAFVALEHRLISAPTPDDLIEKVGLFMSRVSELRNASEETPRLRDFFSHFLARGTALVDSLHTVPARVAVISLAAYGRFAGLAAVSADSATAGKYFDTYLALIAANVDETPGARPITLIKARKKYDYLPGERLVVDHRPDNPRLPWVSSILPTPFVALAVGTPAERRARVRKLVRLVLSRETVPLQMGVEGIAVLDKVFEDTAKPAMFDEVPGFDRVGYRASLAMFYREILPRLKTRALRRKAEDRPDK